MSKDGTPGVKGQSHKGGTEVLLIDTSLMYKELSATEIGVISRNRKMKMSVS